MAWDSIAYKRPKCISHSSESWKAKIKVQEWLGSGEGSFPGNIWQGWGSAGPWPVRNQATQQEVSGASWWISSATPSCSPLLPHRSHYCLNIPHPCPPLMEGLSSTKLVPGAQKFRDRCSKRLIQCSESTDQGVITERAPGTFTLGSRKQNAASCSLRFILRWPRNLSSSWKDSFIRRHSNDPIELEVKTDTWSLGAFRPLKEKERQERRCGWGDGSWLPRESRMTSAVEVRKSMSGKQEIP